METNNTFHYLKQKPEKIYNNVHNYFLLKKAVAIFQTDFHKWSITMINKSQFVTQA